MKRSKERILSLTRSYRLPALHALSGPELSDSQACSIFGPCSRLHGHDYRIEVTLSGTLDPATGMLIRRDEFDQRVSTALIDRLRGENLNEHFTFTTGEALAVEFCRILSGVFPSPVRLTRVRVHETAKNSFDCGP